MADDPWVTVHITIPLSWRNWLHEAAKVRATTMTAIVRQLIRELMIRRHGAE